MKPQHVFLALSCFLFSHCDDEKDAEPTTNEVPAVFEKFYGATDMYVEGDYIVIKSTAVPDHKSPYFEGTEWESTMWIADTRPGFQQAPNNKVSSINFTFKIPKTPTESANKTPLGTATIGVAVNGVPLFNQYAAGQVPITTNSMEYLSFDLYGGHPTPFHEYHYHIEPNYITDNEGRDALVGFLLDGFPVYGPEEDGEILTSNDLDVYHGHSHATADYPDGIYHYHITADSPYINGNGYFGVPGTWSK
ncbi:MAG TPA: YHYH protein [Chryseosolibacter sp.]|nr:YHYH protein [Chryseosolibacter sp.]